MINWCSYCHSFIGEEQPFEVLQISHGICPRCHAQFEEDLDTGVDTMVPDEAKLTSLRKLVQAASDSINHHDADMDFRQWTNAAVSSGIRESDVLIGLLQPLLAHVGDLFARGQISVALEHKVTSRVEDMLADKLADLAATEHVDMVFFMVGGNTHTLGPVFYSMAMKEQGLRGVSLPETTSVDELFACLDEVKPAAVGLSAALPDQLREAEVIARELRSRYPDLLLALGGYAAKASATDELRACFDFVADPHATKESLLELKKAIHSRMAQA